MDSINRLNKAMEYIENNLKEEIDFDKIGQIAGCTQYQFRKMFSYLSDMTLSEYIRKRRLSCASEDIYAGKKIIDIAMIYGYDSPEAFSKAFKSMFSISPMNLRKSKNNIELFPSLTFQLILNRGENKMEKLIEKITDGGIALEVVYRPETLFVGKLAYAPNLESEPDISNLLNQYHDVLDVKKIDVTEPEWEAGISIDYWKEGVPCGMMYGQATSSETQDKCYDIYRMPASNFMRVLHDENAAKALGKDQCEIWELYGLLKDIMMPKYGYKFNENGAQEFEYYNVIKQDYNFIYVPVIKI